MMMEKYRSYPDTGLYFFQYDPRFSGPPGVQALENQYGPRHFNMPMVIQDDSAVSRQVPEEYLLRMYFRDLPLYQEEAALSNPVRGLLG